MKRKFFAVFAVLLVLALVTCDSGSGTEEPVTEGGMVHLTINVGDVSASRALTLAGAQGVVNAAGGFFEVVFKDGSDYYRKSWAYGTTGTIDVPARTYTGWGEAVLFAGRESDKTLLAIGAITKINTGTPFAAGSAAVIDNNTTSVTFTLSALISGVTSNKTTSSFQILGPISATANSPTDFTTDHQGIGTSNGNPFFYLPAKDYNGYVSDSSATDGSSLNKINNIVGCYTINCGTAGAANTYYSSVIVKSWSVTPAPADTTYTANLINDSFIPRYPATNAALTDGKFYFNIETNTTGSNNGYCKVSLVANVVAIIDQDGIGNVTPIPWVIKGGLDNNTVDNSNTGGAFVLKVGSLITIEIDPILP